MKDCPTSVLEFPDELLFLILSYLPPYELQRVSQTCAKFNELLYEEDVWRSTIVNHCKRVLVMRKRLPTSGKDLLTHAKGFDTIVGAMENAQDGDHLLLLPGIYTESIVLEKSIHIIGWDPDRTKTVITSLFGCVINSISPKGSVKNVSLKQEHYRSAIRHQGSFCVDISSGEILISECDVTSNSRSCFGIHKKGCSPTIHNNVIHGSQAAGICVFDYATPEVTENEICNSKYSGVEITQGACPILKKNKIHSNMGSGVYIHTRGMGTLYENDIYNNESSGVSIRSDGNPLLEKNIIRDGKRTGVYAYEDGKGKLVENQIMNNAYNGIETLSSALILENNLEHGNKKVPPEIEKALARGDCTFKITGVHHSVQNWYHCYSCKLFDNDGCCVSCAEKCHKGHDLRYYKFGLFFCDCGDRNANCKALCT